MNQMISICEFLQLNPRNTAFFLHDQTLNITKHPHDPWFNVDQRLDGRSS